MTEAREALDEGLADLVEQLGVTFTVDGFGERAFVGLCEEAFNSNELGEGGFLPEGEGVLAVQPSEFAAVGLTPFPGLRVKVYSRGFIVVRVSRNAHRWALTLQESHPKRTDLPVQQRVVGTAGKVPIKFAVGEVATTKPTVSP